MHNQTVGCGTHPISHGLGTGPGPLRRPPHPLGRRVRALVRRLRATRPARSPAAPLLPPADTVAALARSVEAKDAYTGGHAERVARIASAIARRMGFSGSTLKAVELGALLHDVGKLGVPDPILRKPGPLDEREWEIVRQHPIASDRILSGIDLHPIVRQIARWSHERLDGTGYPDALAADEVPLPARIVHVADAYDALTSDRPYRRRRGAAAALEELRRHAGTQFCAEVVAALEAIHRDQPALLAPESSGMAEAA